MLERHVGFEAREPHAVLPVVADLGAAHGADVLDGEAGRGQRVSKAVAIEQVGVEAANTVTEIAADVKAGPGPERAVRIIENPRNRRA